MSHTPGKWSFNGGAVFSDIDEDGPLIAQAPALLEVAQLVVAHAQHDMPEGILRAATIAVARAKGRIT